MEPFGIQEVLSETFGVPIEWFTFPEVLPYFIIPLIGLILMWYAFFSKIKIFRKVIVNVGISVIIALVNSFLIGKYSPTFTTIASFGIAILIAGRLTGWRILATLVIVGMVFFLTSRFTIFGMMGYFIVITAVIMLMGEPERFKMKLIIFIVAFILIVIILPSMFQPVF